MKCIVDGCTSNRNSLLPNSGVSLHRIPNDNLWWEILSPFVKTHAAARSNQNLRICSHHFLKDDFLHVNGKRILKNIAFPRIFPKGGEQFPSSFQEINDPRFKSHIMPTLHPPKTLPQMINEQNRQNQQTSFSSNPASFHDLLILNQPSNQHNISSPNVASSSEPKAKRFRYAGDIPTNRKLSPAEAQNAVPILQSQLSKTKQKCQYFKQRNRLLEKKLVTLQSTIEALKEQNLINASEEALLQSYSSDRELIKEIISGRKPYSERLKSFATTLHFHSKKAYTYVREALGNNMPHPSSIIRWYRSVSGEPGLTTETLEVLETKAKSLGDRPLLANLTMDEMAIRQLVEWNPYIKKFEGTVTYAGHKDSSDKVSVAKESLVFVVTSLEEDWKVPVAYFLINGLNAAEKKKIVETVLLALQDAGVTIVGFTFDGTATNVAMANSLGCHLKIDDQPLITSFEHPSKTHHVHVLLDACHMLKLVRNVFASQKVLKTMSGDAKWTNIEELNEKQNLTGKMLAQNLTDHHVHFENQKMKVVLAAQTLSQSVADAISFLQHNCQDSSFEDADATVEFLRVFNDVFDILNSSDNKSQIFKQPLNRQNYEALKERLKYGEKFIKSIKTVSGESIFKTPYKTGFLGFLVDINSLLGIYDEFVDKKQVLSEIRSYRMSQDHVETYFATVRAKGGSNNNPTGSQFKATYKRLLTNHNITASNKANCTDFQNTKMLHVTASRDIRVPDSSNEQLETDGDDDIKLRLLDESVEFVDDLFDNKCIEQDTRSVQKKVLKYLKCDQCYNSVTCNQSDSSVNATMLVVCQVADLEFNLLVAGNQRFNVERYYEMLVDCTLKRIQRDYPEVIIHCDEHKVQLLKLIIDYYLRERLHRYSKTIKPFKKSTRNKLTKLILFEGH